MWRRFIKIIKRPFVTVFKKIKYNLSNDKCYSDMKKEGIVKDGVCNGLAGGDRYSEYLQYSCMDCKYYK